MAFSARVNLVEATTFIDLVIFSMFLTDFSLAYEEKRVKGVVY